MFFKKLKIELPYDPANSTPIYPKKTKTLNRKDVYGNPPGGPVVRAPPSTPGGSSSIPGQVTKIPHATRPKKSKKREKTFVLLCSLQHYLQYLTNRGNASVHQ